MKHTFVDVSLNIYQTLMLTKDLNFISDFWKLFDNIYYETTT